MCQAFSCFPLWVHAHVCLSGFYLRQFPDWWVLSVDISLNLSVSSVSTARKLKSGSASAVTLLAASLPLSEVCDWPQLNCECGARTTAISAVIVNHYLSNLAIYLLGVDFFFFFLLVRRYVWKELWQCIVPYTHVAQERCPLGVNNLLRFLYKQLRWEGNGTRLALTWHGAARR